MLSKCHFRAKICGQPSMEVRMVSHLSSFEALKLAVDLLADSLGENLHRAPCGNQNSAQIHVHVHVHQPLGRAGFLV